MTDENPIKILKNVVLLRAGGYDGAKNKGKITFSEVPFVRHNEFGIL